MLKLSIKIPIHRVEPFTLFSKHHPSSSSAIFIVIFFKNSIANFELEFTCWVCRKTIFMISHFEKGTPLHFDNFQTYLTHKEEMINQVFSSAELSVQTD